VSSWKILRDQPISGIGISFYNGDYGDPAGDITLAIHENDASIPGALISGTSKSFTPVYGQWNYIIYSEPGITLNTGSSNTYWIVLSAIDQSGDGDAYRIHRSGSSTYDRGTRKVFNSGGSGIWSTAQTGDLAFRIYGDASLPVMVTHFTAMCTGNHMILKWETASETEIVGFYVLRSGIEQGPYVKINTAIIPGQGNNSSGKTYQYIDEDVNLDDQYWYQIEVLNTNGCSNMIGPVSTILRTGSIIPQENRLYENYPNPFNPSTKICYEISGEDASIHTVLTVYNLYGQEIRILVNQVEEAGSHSVIWDGRNRNGVEVPSGIYFYQLKIGDEFVEMKKMVKVK
jgi:hypothetical protein